LGGLRAFSVECFSKRAVVPLARSVRPWFGGDPVSRLDGHQAILPFEALGEEGAGDR
jgi:hypothetical protein